jgi:hypothetical protein
MTVSFAEAEAKRTRRAERSIRRSVGVAEKIGGEMLAKIAGTLLDKPGEIAAMGEQERQEIIDPSGANTPAREIARRRAGGR